MLIPNITLQRIALVLAGIIIVITVGCRWPMQPRPVKVTSTPSPEASKQYVAAIDAYLAKNYSAAAMQFGAFREQTTDPVMARLALYGEVCSRLMAANDPQSYSDALALWDNWAKMAPQRWDRENPLLFAPVIEKKMLFSNLPLTPDNTTAEEKEETVPLWIMIQTAQEMERLKESLNKSRQSLTDHQKKIEKLEKENARLKKQIKALEVIDQKIQKKKDAIPSAD